MDVVDVLCGTLPMFVGVVVVSALGMVLMFWSESKYVALMELSSSKRSVGGMWMRLEWYVYWAVTDVFDSGGRCCPCHGRSCLRLTPSMLFSGPKPGVVVLEVISPYGPLGGRGPDPHRV